MIDCNGTAAFSNAISGQVFRHIVCYIIRTSTYHLQANKVPSWVVSVLNLGELLSWLIHRSLCCEYQAIKRILKLASLASMTSSMDYVSACLHLIHAKNFFGVVYHQDLQIYLVPILRINRTKSEKISNKKKTSKKGLAKPSKQIHVYELSSSSARSPYYRNSHCCIYPSLSILLTVLLIPCIKKWLKLQIRVHKLIPS